MPDRQFCLIVVPGIGTGIGTGIGLGIGTGATLFYASHLTQKLMIAVHTLAQ